MISKPTDTIAAARAAADDATAILLAELAETRCDAGRLAIALNMAYDAMMRHDFGTITICPFAKAALDAHWKA